MTEQTNELPVEDYQDEIPFEEQQQILEIPVAEPQHEPPEEEPQTAIFFSASTLAFYDTAIWEHELPHDAVQVETQTHCDLLASQSQGLVLAADSDGCPIAVAPPEPSDQVLADRARLERDNRIANVQWLIERHRSEVSLQLSTTLTDEDYLLVHRYVQDLRDVPEQDSFPHDIQWPSLPSVLLETGS